MQGVGRNPRSGGDWAQKPAMKGEARIRKSGDAIRSPAPTAAQSIVKIVLFRQDMVPSPFVEGLGPVDNYLSQTIMQVMQIMDMKAWAVLS